MFGRFAGSALDLFVAIVADEKNFEIIPSKTHSLTVDLGNQWAGCIDGLQIAVGGLLDNGRRDTVGTKHNMSARWDFIDLINENYTLFFKAGNNMNIVNDLLTHVYRRTVALQSLLDRDNRPVYSCTVASGGCKKHTFCSVDRGIL